MGYYFTCLNEALAVMASGKLLRTCCRRSRDALGGSAKAAFRVLEYAFAGLCVAAGAVGRRGLTASPIPDARQAARCQAIPRDAACQVRGGVFEAFLNLNQAEGVFLRFLRGCNGV